VTTVAVDLAKSVFQLAVEEEVCHVAVHPQVIGSHFPVFARAIAFFAFKTKSG
jgi:hypothetical protein